MTRRRKDFDAGVAMYLAGASCGDVADSYGVSRQSMWKCLRRRIPALRPMHGGGETNFFWLHGEGYGPEKVKARAAVMQAIITGRLVRGPCETCGSTAKARDGRALVHGHHEDYSKPLDVRWLCQLCHFAEHYSR